MGCRGLHIALQSEQVAALKALPNGERVDYMIEKFEEELWAAHKDRAQETDKAWDAIHRCLTDGTLKKAKRFYPLGYVILGGEDLYNGNDYIMSLKTPQQVQDILTALADMTEDRFRAAYERIKPRDYEMPLSDEDFNYSWSWFQGLLEFYRKTAAGNYWVLFTADQ